MTDATCTCSWALLVYMYKYSVPCLTVIDWSRMLISQSPAEMLGKGAEEEYLSSMAA